MQKSSRGVLAVLHLLKGRAAFNTFLATTHGAAPMLEGVPISFAGSEHIGPRLEHLTGSSSHKTTPLHQSMPSLPQQQERLASIQLNLWLQQQAIQACAANQMPAPMWADSVRRKRKHKMNKHKHRKRLKSKRHERK
ncbi:hypothetical protein WJX74_010117 [Apatococcus lobatus]|uniref:Small ribosomal subunit protein mS38 n=1 Tax=Apatococcus lobatus TaxID=904363 RepID=A0AAW1R0A8_9CHLO